MDRDLAEVLSGSQEHAEQGNEQSTFESEFYKSTPFQFLSKYAMNQMGEFDLNIPPIGECFNWCCVAANLLVRESGVPNVDACKIRVRTPWNIAEWEKQLTDYDKNPELIELIKYGFPLECEPKGGSEVVHPNHKGATGYSNDIRQYLKTELEAGSLIGPFKSNPFGKSAHFSLINTRAKRESTERRVILDLSWPQDGSSVNKGINKSYYRGKKVKCTLPCVEDLIKIIRSKRGKVLVFKRDLKRAYKQIMICVGSLHVLGIFFEENYYYDISLPMGLINSALICQEISSAIVFIYGKEGFQAINYLDDLGGAEEQQLAVQAFEVLSLVLQSLGVKEAEAKAHPPGMWVVFLGILINTYLMRLEIEPQRLEEILEELGEWLYRRTATLRQLQSLIGKLSFCATTMRAGRLFYARILNFVRKLHDTNPYKQVTIPEQVYRDVQWWIISMKSFNGISMIPAAKWIGPNRIFQTDACLTGIGGWSHGFYFHRTLPEFLVAQKLDINMIECWAIIVAIKHWGYKLSGSNSLLQCDNQVCVNCINEAKAKNPYMQALLREICFICAINDCQIRAVYIPTYTNRIADSLSRYHLSQQHRLEFTKLTRGLNKTEIHVQDSDFLLSNPW